MKKITFRFIDLEADASNDTGPALVRVPLIEEWVAGGIVTGSHTRGDIRQRDRKSEWKVACLVLLQQTTLQGSNWDT